LLNALPELTVSQGNQSWVSKIEDEIRGKQEPGHAEIWKWW
jgi:pyrroloquinoline quinone (PQQ) biosynthesis protein C